MRPDDRERLCVHVRHVHRVAHFAAHQHRANLLCDLDAHIFLCLRRARTEVRREDDVRQRTQREICGRRLDFVHIQRGCCDLAALQRIVQRLLVNEPAACAVDDPHALLRLREPLGVEHVLRLVRERHVHRDVVGKRHDFIEALDQLHLQRTRAACGEIRVVCEDAHAECDRAPCDLRADAAHAENGERLAVKFDTLERLAVPFARLHRRIRLRDVARDRHEQAERVLCRGDRVARGRVHHHHAALRRGLHVHIVHADTGSSHDLQFLRRLDDARIHLRLRAHDEAVELADDLEKFVFFQAGLHRHVEQTALLQFGNAALTHRICHQDFWFVHCAL